jgi:hypothetical protein
VEQNAKVAADSSRLQIFRFKVASVNTMELFAAMLSCFTFALMRKRRATFY